MGCGLSKAQLPTGGSHAYRNARLTFHGRLLIVQRHQDGWTQAHTATAMGVSRTCVATWIKRCAAEGLPAHESRRPDERGPHPHLEANRPPA
ncbi:hypothetical protein GCM10009595_00320 [Falsarthrobacter nasiphocae]|nr:leucine zipper domain-containing protein [Falsarthrobacter nasiphocae]